MHQSAQNGLFCLGIRGCRVSAWRPSYFLLLRQKKVCKLKASRRPWPCGLPCATRAARGQAQTRFAQTCARPDPSAAALLSTGEWRKERFFRHCIAVRKGGVCICIWGYRVSAWRPTHFSLLRQRKVSKRKASRRPWPCGLPCATRAARGQAQTRFAQTCARPDPSAAALLSTAEWQLEAACSFAGANIVRSSSRSGAAPIGAAPARAPPVGTPTRQPLTTTAAHAHVGHQKRTATFRQ